MQKMPRILEKSQGFSVFCIISVFWSLKPTNGWAFVSTGFGREKYPKNSLDSIIDYSVIYGVIFNGEEILWHTWQQ